MCGLARETLGLYSRYWRLWVEFCDLHRVPRAARDADIQSFVDWMHHSKGWKGSSIRSLLGGLATVHKML